MINEVQELRVHVLNLMGSLTGRIPVNLSEWSRQRFIHDEIMPTLSREQSDLLYRFGQSLLLEMRRHDASDIEIGGYGARGFVWIRVQGRKMPLDSVGEFDPDQFSILIQGMLSPEVRIELLAQKSVDFSYVVPAGPQKYRYRATAYFDLGDLALNMRAINNRIWPFKDYAFHPNIVRLLNLAQTQQGLILLTGITGSGKSTTLDSILNLNNKSVEGHIVVIASPVEFIHDSDKCIIRHREVGRDTQSFKTGIIEALRQDPDIIAIGEMRDPQTIMAALEAADTGHKVFSTLHTGSAVESVERIIAEMPPLEQNRVRMRLADTLTCVISQKLVPGNRGRRVLAKEVLAVTPSVRAAIKSNNLGEIYQMISEGSQWGMFTMEQDLVRLYKGGQIDVEAAMNYANNKRRMQQQLQMSRAKKSSII